MSRTSGPGRAARRAGWFRREAGVLLLALLLAWPAAAEPGFVQGVEDLPLMPGLTEVSGAGVVFDKPDGRIVEAYAVGDGLSAGEVVGFYRATLPQLGWQRRDDTTYEREGERLRLGFDEKRGLLTVRFDISPR